MQETAKVLIVEDDPVLKQLLSHELSGAYALSYASDGAEALAVFEKERPALMLLDLMLPKLDGFAVLERIRARSDILRNVPVIVLSNLDQANDEARARAAGANEYLVKANVSIEEIIQHVNHLVVPSTPEAGART